MAKGSSPLWRRLLPWAVSAGALAYVFGAATNWQALLRATEQANLPPGFPETAHAAFRPGPDRHST